MKSLFITIFSLFVLFFTAPLFADCGGDCGPAVCNPYVTTCQCTDPACFSVDRTCMSTGECCEAFGNMGAR